MYQILIKKRAKKFIDKLPATEKRRAVEAIERLPEGDDIKKLRGYERVLRLRVGPYRIIYEVDNDRFIVTVIDAGNKRQIQGFVEMQSLFHGDATATLLKRIIFMKTYQNTPCVG